MIYKHWFMRSSIPMRLWTELQARNLTKKGTLDEFVTKAIEEKLERDDINDRGSKKYRDS